MSDPDTTAEDEDLQLDTEAEGDEPEVEVDENGDPIEAEEDDSEDYEHDGKAYKVPKALKPLLMKDADYTQKTQSLAAERKEVEEGRALVLQQATTHRAVMAEAAKVLSLNEQLAEYEKVSPEQWLAAQQQDPDKVSSARLAYQLLREERDRAIASLQTKERERLDIGQRETAKAVEQRDAVLARDIKGWTKESLGKLADDPVVKAYGISKEEIAQSSDPRTIKVLHRLATLEKAQKKQATVASIEKAQAIVPAPRAAGGSAPKPGLRDDLSVEEWNRRRNAQRAANSGSGRR